MKLKLSKQPRKTVSSMVRQPTECKDIITSYTSDRKLVGRLYKELKHKTPRKLSMEFSK